MKKLIGKLLKREEKAPLGRITSDTMAEHREQILAGGRRFKYPLQYSRHKLVFNAIAISLAALIIITIFGWWRLYVVNDTGEFMYRVTRVVPLQVAKIDGQPVRYSDYLMSYRSSIYYSEKNEQLSVKTDEGKRKVELIKEQAMRGALADAYAQKLAKGLSLSISDSELEGFIKEQRQSINGEMSQQTFDASTLEILGLSPSEYRHMISSALLRYKVSYAIDKPALAAANKAIELINGGAGGDFKSLAASVSTASNVNAVYGSSGGMVSKTNQDGGLAAAAAKLSKGQTSTAPVKSSRGDGYYILKLLDINETQVSYEYVSVPLTELSSELNKIINTNKVKKYISVKSEEK